MSSWSRGRVTLLGDAASCVSLFGDGSSSAMEGAATLAASLATTAWRVDRFPPPDPKITTGHDAARPGPATRRAAITQLRE